MLIRIIEPNDNVPLAAVITKSMQAFTGDLSNTILGDPTMHSMYGCYQEERSRYYIVEDNNMLIGGCGIKQLPGANSTLCELQRLFLLPEAQGKGIGYKLLQLCLVDSLLFKYEKMYLETLSQMTDAIKLYHRNGFKEIEFPLGNTGHGGCNVFMIKNLLA